MFSFHFSYVVVLVFHSFRSNTASTLPIVTEYNYIHWKNHCIDQTKLLCVSWLWVWVWVMRTKCWLKILLKEHRCASRCTTWIIYKHKHHSLWWWWCECHQTMCASNNPLFILTNTNIYWLWYDIIIIL